jgi:hypothetical protein
MPRGSKCYMRQHGAQCRGIDSRPDKSCLCGRRGESCARPGAASRVVALELLFGRRPYAGSRA